MSKSEKDNNALSQYRALVEEHDKTIAANTAPAIKRARAEAAAILKYDTSLRLPQKGDEGYVYSDINAMFAPDLGLNIMRLPVGTDLDSVFKCGLPTISSLLGITVNDSFRPTERMERLLPQGVTVKSFSKADDSEKDLIEKYYNRVNLGETTEAARVFNTALAQDGILIKVSAGVCLEKPIQIVNILQPMASNAGITLPVLAVRRILVVMEPGSRATVLVCDHNRPVSGDSSASSRITEIVMERNSRLDWYELEESSDMSSRHAMTYASQAAHSSLTVFSGTLRPGHTRNDFDIRLTQGGASLRMDGLAIADRTTVADNNTCVVHCAPHCDSSQTFKYLVDDEGRGAFEGLIRVDHGAFATQAFQNNRNILASGTARMHTRPQLEIYCDDVKCSHGAATGQLDEQALFYMRSRGIDLPDARRMLMNAFMADVIESVSLEPLRDRLRHLVEKRLSGNDARCEGCELP